MPVLLNHPPHLSWGPRQRQRCTRPSISRWSSPADSSTRKCFEIAGSDMQMARPIL